MLPFFYNHLSFPKKYIIHSYVSLPPLTGKERAMD